MKELKIWATFALLFCFAGVAPAGAASDASLDRMVTQIESLFPPMEGVVVSVDGKILTLDLKLGQPIKKGDRLNLIHFGSDIIHPVTKKKIGRKETDLGEVEVLEVRQNFSLAKLLDPTVLARPGDGVRSPFNTLSFLVAPPSIGVSKKIDRDRLRLELEKKLADHPRFDVPVFELGLWLLENNLDVPNLLKKKNLRKLNSRVKADFLLVPSVKSVKKKLVLGYKLYSAQTGQLEKEAQILSNQLPIEQARRERSRRERDIQRDFSRPNEGLLEYVGKQEFWFKIVDFDVGDINGDGREELIVVAPNRVIVYTYKNKNLKQALTFRADNENHKFLGVDVGDINRNGRDEIFVTDQLGDSLTSFVLEARPGKKR
ncbi:MAG: VCBS repeat-containing protein, partial [Nitrospinaceae bacterium]|nr:VCBS repeat-containing protein [Nitrospinaceae bacterium]